MNDGYHFLKEVGIKAARESITREALVRELFNQQTIDKMQNEEGEEILYTHSSLNIFAPELTVFLGYHNHELVMDITDWFDCPDDWAYRTKTQGVEELINVWVNLLGATTPRLIRSSLPMDAIGGGLTSRVIFVYASRKGKSVPFPFLSEEQKTEEKKLIMDLEQIHSLNGRFTFSEGFMEAYGTWYMEKDEEDALPGPHFANYNDRRQVHLLSLCMVISASEGSSMHITESHFDRALALLRRTEEQMPRVFSGVGQSRVSDSVATMMDYIARKKELTMEELLSRFYAEFEGHRQIEDILSAMRKQGFIRMKTNGQRTLIEYNPDNLLDKQYRSPEERGDEEGEPGLPR